VSKPYDAATKDLIETDPAGWVAFLGGVAPPESVRLVDADLSSVTAEADKIIRVEEPEPWLLHLELQASRDESLARRMLRYNALLHERHRLPVASVAVLLRSAANDTRLNGELKIRPAIGPEWTFRHEVVRVWQLRPEVFLKGPIGLIPLAPLSQIREPDLPDLIEAMRGRIDPQPEPSLRGKLWVATYLLMGLRYTDDVVEQLLSGVRQMEESTTYQSLLRRGLQQGVQQGSSSEARKLLLRAGHRRLGVVPPAVNAAIEAIDDTTRLESLFDRVLTATSWDELFQAP
jgi:predicted transposase YdaD